MGRHTRQEVLLPEFQMIVEVLERHNGHKHVLPQTFIRGVKQADIPITPKCRTIVQRFKDHKAAERFGARIGRVISCHKVDYIPYLKNIEYLNLKQEPQKGIRVEIDKETFELGQDFVITKTGLTIGEIEKDS